MFYAYEASIARSEGDYFVVVTAFGEAEGCYGGGDTLIAACEDAMMALRLTIAAYLRDGRELPRSAFQGQPAVVLGVDVDDEFVRSTACLTHDQAAQELGVSKGRVSQLVTSGALESVTVGGRRLVTIASVERRRNHPVQSGRPKTAPVSTA